MYQLFFIIPWSYLERNEIGYFVVLKGLLGFRTWNGKSYNNDHDKSTLCFMVCVLNGLTSQIAKITFGAFFFAMFLQ